MTAAGSLDVDTLTPVWTAGWQWPWAVVLTLMLGTNFLFAADQPIVGVAVLLSGGAVTVAGVRAVGAESTALHRAGVDKIHAAAERRHGDVRNVRTVTLSGGTESVVGLDAAKRYETTVLVVDDASVAVYGGHVNLIGTAWHLDDHVESLACAQIETIAYDDATVGVSLTDGTSRTYPSDDRPTALLVALEHVCPEVTGA